MNNFFATINQRWLHRGLSAKFPGGIHYQVADARSVSFPHVVFDSLANSHKGRSSHTNYYDHRFQLVAHYTEDGTNDPVEVGGQYAEFLMRLLDDLDSADSGDARILMGDEGDTKIIRGVGAGTWKVVVEGTCRRAKPRS